MRNLRVDIRTFTEPVEIWNSTQTFEEGVAGEPTFEKVGEMYANVISSKENYNLNSNDLSSEEVVEIQIRSTSGIEFKPQQTKIKIRGQFYLFQKLDDFGINTEIKKIYAIKV